MKKLIGFILFLSLPAIFLAVYLRNEFANKNISSAHEAPSINDVYIDMQVQSYGYKSNLGEEIFEIPLFVSTKGDNKEIHKLNNKIAPLLNLYNGNYGFKQDEDTWEVKSYPFTSDSYLQVITTATIYPNYSTQGDVYSYNYDIKNEKIITLKDAYNKDHKSESEISNNIKELYKTLKSSEENTLVEVKIKGFLIGDTSIRYFVNLTLNNSETGDFSTIYTYNSSDNTLKEYDGVCLIDPNEPDKFVPELYFERADVKEKFYSNEYGYVENN